MTHRTNSMTALFRARTIAGTSDLRNVAARMRTMLSLSVFIRCVILF